MLDPESAKMFVISANFPMTYRSVAYELIAAGNLCFRRYTRISASLKPPSTTRYHEDVSPRSFLMLYAFALEGLLKALWLAQGNQAATAGTAPQLHLNSESTT